MLTLLIPFDRYQSRWARAKAYFDTPGTLESQNSIYRFSDLLRGGITLSDSIALDPGTAILVTKRLLTIPAQQRPDKIAIRASAVSPDGRSHTAETSLAVVAFEAKTAFRFPVRGRWYVAASSSVRSHHRIRPAHEFALDLIKIGDDGSSHRKDGTKPEDYFAYGEPVHAVADGTVVQVVNDIPDTEMPRKGESRRDFAVRVLDAMWTKDPTGHVAGGNQVVLEHAGGEHSIYVHLAPGSVPVQVGDVVQQGQRIGKVGISGDGFQPHLHFQVNDGPDPQFSRGLPVIFSDVRPVPFSSTIDMKPDRLYMAGEFVETAD